MYIHVSCAFLFFFQAEDGIRDLVRSRGLGDVYKRQERGYCASEIAAQFRNVRGVQVKALKSRVRTTARLSLIHI